MRRMKTTSGKRRILTRTLLIKYSGPPIINAVGTFHHKIFIVHDDKRRKTRKIKKNVLKFSQQYVFVCKTIVLKK